MQLIQCTTDQNENAIDVNEVKVDVEDVEESQIEEAKNIEEEVSDKDSWDNEDADDAEQALSNIQEEDGDFDLVKEVDKIKMQFLEKMHDSQINVESKGQLNDEENQNTKFTEA